MSAKPSNIRQTPLSLALRSTRSSARRLAFVTSVAVALVGGNLAMAAEFTIQVGAFKNPSQAFAEEVRQYGEVNSAQNGRGITIFTLGRYGSKGEAQADLARIQDAYPGAYVRNMPSSARTPNLAESSAAPSTAKASKATSIVSSTSTPEAALWESLTDAERRRVVYLDGVLHLKQGENFVPLSQYRRDQVQ